MKTIGVSLMILVCTWAIRVEAQPIDPCTTSEGAGWTTVAPAAPLGAWYCASRGAETWRERVTGATVDECHEGGAAWEPGIGSASIGADGAGFSTITYTYGVGPSYSFYLCSDGASYRFVQIGGGGPINVNLSCGCPGH